jgi:predicted Zn-dependent protease
MKIEMQKLSWRARNVLFSCGLFFFFLSSSCSTQANIPTVSDDLAELLVRNEAAQIVAVSEDKGRFSEYQIFLSDFPRKDILGMSIGNRRIYISHELAKRASRRSSYLWLLRQTLAHEIAHETADHALRNGGSSFNYFSIGRGISGIDVGLPLTVRFRPYSVEKELDADLRGLQYWGKLGWDCHIWVGILRRFRDENYPGDVLHPTDKRLHQAQGACLARKYSSEAS